MRCKACLKEDATHTVTQGWSMRTAVGVMPPYWDENDNYVVPLDPNTTTTIYYCSNGHEWRQYDSNRLDVASYTKVV